MRRILIDRARERKVAPNMGGIGAGSISKISFRLPRHVRSRFLAMDEALDIFLRWITPKRRKLIRLRYYAGCTLAEAAELMGISTATAKRRWSYARAWLYNALSDR